MATKPFRKSIVTPAGIAVYPWLNAPDVRFGDPTFKVNLRVTGEEAVAFIAEVDKIKEEALAHLGAKELVVPIVQAVDTDKVVIEGAYDIKCKAKAFFKQADGSLVENNITIVDAQKNKMDESAGTIWGGSKLKVALNIGAVSTAVYSGLMFRINAVQVLELVTGGQGGANAFDKEDGFTAEPKATPVVAEGEDESIDF